MPDLPATKGDCEAIRLSGKKYGITDAGPDDMYIMEEAPTRNQYQQAIRHIVRRLQDNPEKGHLILSCFAGHGIQYFGQQALLTNEFDERTWFYKICHVEKKLRALASMFKNVYIIVVFPCCRELSDKERHLGGVSKVKAKKLQAEGERGLPMNLLVGRLENIQNANYEEFEA